MHLSYLSLKSIIWYLEPNSRIQLSQRSPAFKSIDFQDPLQIEQLKINEHSLTINKTIYKLEVESSLGSRAIFDLDQLGSVDLTTVLEQRPEEILVDGRSFRWNGNSAVKLKDQSECEQIRQEAERISGIQDGEEKDRALNRFRRRALIYQGNFLRGYARTNPTAPQVTMIQIPISYCIRLTVGNLHTEIVGYTLKLHDAINYLARSLLGGRKNIKIRKLFLSCVGTIRIPANLDLQFKHLEVRGVNTDKIVKAFQPLIENLKDPLDIFEIIDKDFAQLTGPIYQSARLLVFNGTYQPYQLADKRNIRFTSALGIMEEYLGLYLDYWVNNRKEVGTCWTFELDQESEARVFLGVIKKDGRAEQCEESSVTFPIDKSAEIYIYIQEIEIGGVEQRNRWELNFTVRAKS